MTNYRIEHYTGSSSGKVEFLTSIKAETAESALRQHMGKLGTWIVEARTPNYATALDVATPEGNLSALVAEVA